VGARGGGGDRDAKLLEGASGRGRAEAGEEKGRGAENINSVGISHDNENERGKGFSARFSVSRKAMLFCVFLIRGHCCH
jgi:hypothetical protein